MASEKLVKDITKREEDFAKWYTDIVREAKLCDYSSIKGCLIYEPNGYAIWENIQNNLNKRFKDTGVENVYFPLLIPESLLQKEKDHVKGFAPEVAWVTEGGSEKLEEKLCIRPTSETLFCDYWAKDIESYRDLPKLYNQWNSVLRWEKTTRPFLRSREFLWQEGHTIHASKEEAKERTLQMLKVYYDFITQDLAIPLIQGKKTESEKFAGAEETYTVEALMPDGKALQSATSHFFGDGFAKAFDIKFLNKNNKFEYVNETSWGLSTRIIGAIIMVHSDDSGLVLPPRIAPVQVMVVPIATHKERVISKAEEILNKLKDLNIRSKIDLSDKTAGWKFSNQEVLGIPLRIEIGPKDIENNELILVRRDNKEKIVLSMDNLVKVNEVLEDIQKDMYKNAKEFLDNHIYKVENISHMIRIFNEKNGLVKAMWCGDEKCEEEIKNKTNGATSRCIPFDEENISDLCVCCGKKATNMVIWGKSY